MRPQCVPKEFSYQPNIMFIFNLLNLFKKMVGRIGFEPMTNGLKVQCSTN